MKTKKCGQKRAGVRQQRGSSAAAAAMHSQKCKVARCWKRAESNKINIFLVLLNVN
jgi:hypothetical protein